MSVQNRLLIAQACELDNPNFIKFVDNDENRQDIINVFKDIKKQAGENKPIEKLSDLVKKIEKLNEKMGEVKLLDVKKEGFGQNEIFAKRLDLLDKVNEALTILRQKVRVQAEIKAEEEKEAVEKIKKLKTDLDSMNKKVREGIPKVIMEDKAFDHAFLAGAVEMGKVLIQEKIQELNLGVDLREETRQFCFDFLSNPELNPNLIDDKGEKKKLYLIRKSSTLSDTNIEEEKRVKFFVITTKDNALKTPILIAFDLKEKVWGEYNDSTWKFNDNTDQKLTNVLARIKALKGCSSMDGNDVIPEKLHNYVQSRYQGGKDIIQRDRYQGQKDMDLQALAANARQRANLGVQKLPVGSHQGDEKFSAEEIQRLKDAKAPLAHPAAPTPSKQRPEDLISSAPSRVKETKLPPKVEVAQAEHKEAVEKIITGRESILKNPAYVGTNKNIGQKEAAFIMKDSPPLSYIIVRNLNEIKEGDEEKLYEFSIYGKAEDGKIMTGRFNVDNEGIEAHGIKGKFKELHKLTSDRAEIEYSPAGNIKHEADPQIFGLINKFEEISKGHPYNPNRNVLWKPLVAVNEEAEKNYAAIREEITKACATYNLKDVTEALNGFFPEEKSEFRGSGSIELDLENVVKKLREYSVSPLLENAGKCALKKLKLELLPEFRNFSDSAHAERILLTIPKGKLPILIYEDHNELGTYVVYYYSAGKGTKKCVFKPDEKGDYYYVDPDKKINSFDEFYENLKKRLSPK